MPHQNPLARLRSHGLVASDLLLSPSSHPCIPALQPLPGCACTVGPCWAVGYPTQPKQPPSPRAGSGIVRWVVFRKDGSSQRPGGDKCFFHSLVLMDSQRWEAAANTSPSSQESQPQQSSAGSALPAPASQPCLSPALLAPPGFPQLQALGCGSGCWAAAGNCVGAPVPSAMLGPHTGTPRGRAPSRGAGERLWHHRGGKPTPWHAPETSPAQGQCPAQPGIPGNTHGMQTPVSPRPATLRPRGTATSRSSAPLSPTLPLPPCWVGGFHIPPPHPSKRHPQVQLPALPHC